MSIFSFLNDHSAQVFAILWSISELLAYIPSIKGNGIFECIHLFLLSKKEGQKDG